MSEWVTYYLTRILHALEARFTFATGYRGSIFLLAGGLFLLTFLVMYALAKSLFGRAQPAMMATTARPKVIIMPRAMSRERTLSVPAGNDAFRRGYEDAARARPASLDGLLDHVYEIGLGDARILGSTSTGKLVRLHACANCHADDVGCAYAAGYLCGGFTGLSRRETHVVETTCTRRGDASCEFEVTYA